MKEYAIDTEDGSQLTVSAENLDDATRIVVSYIPKELWQGGVCELELIGEKLGGDVFRKKNPAA